MTQLDVILLAGDRGAARSIHQQNKALLPLDGAPLLAHVLTALHGVSRIRRIAVVGPMAEIQPVLNGFRHQMPILPLEQRNTAYQNFWLAFCHLGQQPGIDDRDPDRAVLVLPADVPLASATELNQFLDNCNLNQLDYCVGMTSHTCLRRFYPTAQQPGISMRYLHLADADLRLNNLHLVKPLRVRNRDYIEDIYDFRYQKKPWNMLRAARDLLRQPGIGWRAVWLYLLLQLAGICHSLRWASAQAFLQRRVERREIEAIASAVLQTRAGIVETTGGGCAVDIDNARDYATVTQRWQEFSRARRPEPVSSEPQD